VVYGVWCVVYGVWCMVYGSVYGAECWFYVPYQAHSHAEAKENVKKMLGMVYGVWCMV